jgi:hypothetical protein
MPNTVTINVFARLSNTDKVGIVFREAAKRLPKAVGDALLVLVSPANLAITAAFFFAFVAGQALGYGLIFDIVAIGGGFLLAGAAAIDGIALLIEAVTKTVVANNQAELEDAGKILAQAVLTIGVATLVALVTKRAVIKTRTPGAIAVTASGRFSTYGELRTFISTSDLRGRFDAHHLWEKQFARLINTAEDDIIAAPVLPRYHRGVNGIAKSSSRPLGIMYGVIDSNIDVMITNYVEQRLMVSRQAATLEQVWIAHREVYRRLGQEIWSEAIYELYVRPRGIPFWGGAK